MLRAEVLLVGTGRVAGFSQAGTGVRLECRLPSALWAHAVAQGVVVARADVAVEVQHAEESVTAYSEDRPRSWFG